MFISAQALTQHQALPSSVHALSPNYPSSYLLLQPPFILHQWLRVDLHFLYFSLLLLYQRGSGHAEDAVDVHSHFDLHFGAFSVWLRSNVLDRKASWGQTQNQLIHTYLQQGGIS